MPRNTPLRNRVKELRERLNIRQSELSREVGITRQTIIAIEKGRLNPSILICLKIAKTLREPVDYIFYLQPGFDYEQEARENAGRPKRGRKKRTPVAAGDEPAPGPAPAPIPQAAKRAAATPNVENPDGAGFDGKAEPIGPSVPASLPAQTETGGDTADATAQSTDDRKSSQAIWDFF